SGGSFDVSSLNLGAEGFRGAVSIRDRSDSALEVSGNVRAKSFELSSDLGSILVNGTIDTSGTTASPGGGAISLSSRGELTLNSAAVLTAAAVRPASGASARAGDITLGSRYGTISLFGGATINIAGQAGSDNAGTSPDGRLLLRAAYDPTKGTVNVNPIGATFVTSQSGTPAVTVEGVTYYNDKSSIGTTGVDLTYSQIASDIAAFSANATTIANALVPASAVKPDGSAAFHVDVRPGIDISSSGDLTVKSTLDLHGLASSSDNNVPIDLTLRAAGNLLINGSISDGFVKPTSPSTAAVTTWKMAPVTTVAGNTVIP